MRATNNNTSSRALYSDYSCNSAPIQYSPPSIMGASYEPVVHVGLTCSQPHAVLVTPAVSCQRKLLSRRIVFVK